MEGIKYVALFLIIAILSSTLVGINKIISIGDIDGYRSEKERITEIQSHHK
ncbi:hypothetical protein fnug_314 [Pseudomonas phage fnug]|uniref:PHIKZ267.1 n=5 Tax=Viruses TaxID=10239 RepID=L7T4B8_BPDPK|nr:hypothetical protein [Pseudomonas aeruginosa]YP_009619596.1 hypothetical protein FDJ06_gp056 [Pseudomonas phage SL2]YP_009639938.1 PHIKZ267.1 [Pseudomonas phage phiKZ]ANM45082.1 hypothetical protein KTN4_324 [Pseudomonas phage KTN4]QJB22957.1 hypothetical protein fnug_314 [Pseudomonas phage fnug]QYV99108.1 hypothetical protein [Pseudomonas phage T2P]QYV99480.1 hypothetical protein [Pseudomonas phage U1B]QYV99570.1 minor tail protein [Pseudomonas phage U5]UXD83295.1 hypothetical protein N